MRKYSGATGLRPVPNIPATFVPTSSPHFVAALRDRGQDYSHGRASVYKGPTAAHTTKKHSTIFQSHLPVIQVTTEEIDGRSDYVQRKESSSGSPAWTGAGLNREGDREGYNTASDETERQRKTSVKGRGVVLGETPLGKDVIFQRKISNTAAPKVDEIEEKERLLMKYSPFNNVPLSGNSRNRMKNMYFSRYNTQTDAGKSINAGPSRSKGSRANELESNWNSRGRAQSLNFVPETEIAHIKDKTTNEVFTSKTFPGADPITSNVYSRNRAQSLNFAIQASGGSAGYGKTRSGKDKTTGLYEIIEEKGRKQSPTFLPGSNNLQIESVVKTNNLSASLFLHPQKTAMRYTFEGNLSPARDNVGLTPTRKISQDRNAFLTFPTLRAKSWTEN